MLKITIRRFTIRHRNILYGISYIVWMLTLIRRMILTNPSNSGECCSLGCRAEKSIAEKCKANNFFSTAINMVSGLFVFKGEDECEQHYKVICMLIPYEILLLGVICEVMSNFIFTSPGVFGLLLLFWLGGYRMRTFMATIEPAGKFVPLIQCHKTVDYWFNEERLKIDTSKSTILRVGLKPVRNTVSSNRRLSTEYISFKFCLGPTNLFETLDHLMRASSCLSHRYPRRELIGSTAVAVANSSLHHITNTARSQL
uniref:Uncharacterized protein n=1 Tax=Wuchereria bancrofti TaxID=6293 RepID=A0A1I8ETK0_WUCBA